MAMPEIERRVWHSWGSSAIEYQVHFSSTAQLPAIGGVGRQTNHQIISPGASNETKIFKMVDVRIIVSIWNYQQTTKQTKRWPSLGSRMHPNLSSFGFQGRLKPKNYEQCALNTSRFFWKIKDFCSNWNRLWAICRTKIAATPHKEQGNRFQTLERS